MILKFIFLLMLVNLLTPKLFQTQLSSSSTYPTSVSEETNSRRTPETTTPETNVSTEMNTAKVHMISPPGLNKVLPGLSKQRRYYMVLNKPSRNCSLNSPYISSLLAILSICIIILYLLVI